MRGYGSGKLSDKLSVKPISYFFTNSSVCWYQQSHSYDKEAKCSSVGTSTYPKCETEFQSFVEHLPSLFFVLPFQNLVSQSYLYLVSKDSFLNILASKL